MKKMGAVSVTIVGLAVFVLLASCATVDSFISVYAKNYLGIRYRATDPASVQILRSDPDRPNVRLGEVVLEPQGDPPILKMEQKLREAASKMGADAAVIVVDTTMRMGSIKVGPLWKREMTPYGRGTMAVAIRYVQ